jgi:serine/threonine protein kinase
VKPGNILHDIKNKKFILIDFGISRKYVDSIGMHIEQILLPKFIGNIEFAAVECLQKFGE